MQHLLRDAKMPFVWVTAGAVGYVMYITHYAVRIDCMIGCSVRVASTYFHDFVYHGALASAAFSTWPFRMPIFAGASMQGYHFLYDLSLSILLRMGVPVTIGYWYVSPAVYMVIIFFVLPRFAARVYQSTTFISIFAFLYFFGGTFSFIATQLHVGFPFGIGVSSLLHTSTVFLYPTVAFSFVIFLLIWQRMLLGKGWAMRDLVSVALLLFLLFGIKFYAAATMLCMIGVYLLLDFIDRKDSRHTLLQASIICLACGVSLVVFYNIQKASAGEPVFGWAPLAAVHQIIEDANMYPNSQLAMARDTLYTIGKFSPRLVAIEGFSLILFTIHHFGLRAVGTAYLVWLIVRKRAVKSDIAACAGMIFSFGMGILFAQRGWHWWNTLQFHYYTALIAAFYTARFVYEIIFLRTDKRYVRIIVILILVLLSIPDAVEKAIEIGKTQHTTVSAVEMQAMQELSRKPHGVVFTAPLMPETAYVSALSGHTLFYADEQMLQNNGIDYVSRKELLSEPENLDLNSIPANYAYLVKSDPNYELLLKKAKDTSFRELYENDEVVLLER